MNQFGGNWTLQKIEMVVGYAKAYLTIMNKYPKYKTLYFDGFAGSGNIIKEGDDNPFDFIKGTAIRILEISSPKSFDLYYFVEKDENNKKELEKTIKKDFPLKNEIYVVCEDCNNKLLTMANYLRNHKNFRALLFIDPYGMSVNWSSIEILKGLGIDLWILVPTGIGVGRLLKNDGKISDPWLIKLEKFLGIEREEIKKRFYREYSYQSLFEDEIVTHQVKERNAINKIHDLYRERLLTVFKFVSEPFVMRNSSNSIMYHFMMATNNPAALKIANDIVKPKFKL